MRSVDRGQFVPENLMSAAYEDRPLQIGHGATISAPHMHGMALELLSPALRPGARVLDVGCGSGYLCAALAHMVGPDGLVVGIDYLSALVDLARKNLSRAHGDLLASGRLKLLRGDGWAGSPDHAPFDAIHVGA